MFRINKECQHDLNHPKLVAPIKKLHYAIKITLKKIRNIQEKINTDANPEASKTADTPRHRRFSQITPPENNLRFITPNFNDLESHSVGTPVMKKSSKTPKTGSSGQAGETGDKYEFLFTQARFSGSGYGGGNDDDDDDDDPKRSKKNSNKKNMEQSGK